MTLDLTNLVTLFCREHALLKPNATVVVAVSGGVDSICLLHVLIDISSRLPLKLVVAHLNHQLRGAEAQADARFVEEAARKRHLPFFLESHNVKEIAAERKQSIEETARQVRYAFLWRVAAQVMASTIAVGHNADDQVETVLMHFLRGSGSYGLAGMSPKTNIGNLGLHPQDIAGLAPQAAPFIIRPFLEQPRTIIEAYCQANRLEYRQDASNQDSAYFRNRLRHNLIPLLETYNSNFRQVVQRTAKVIAAENQLLKEQLSAAWSNVVINMAAHHIEFTRQAWLQLPLALKRATLRQAIAAVANTLQNIGFDHIEQTIDILESGSTGQKITLPHNLVITLNYGTFSVGKLPDLLSGHTSDRPQILSGQLVPVIVPGATPLPGGKWQLIATFVEPGTVRKAFWEIDNWEAYLDADSVTGQLSLRSRLAGDDFAPLGMAGHRQTIKDFMINQKIPAQERGSIPCFVAGDDIVWLCGYRINEKHRVKAETLRVLHLKFEPIEL